MVLFICFYFVRCTLSFALQMLISVVGFNDSQERRTALMYAAGAGHLEVVNAFLLDRRVDVNMQDEVRDSFNRWHA